MNKVKVALIGYGHLGKWHAQKAQTLECAELVAIVDPSEHSRNEAAKAFPKVKIVKALSEIIEDIDAGLIVTPTTYHFETAKELLLSNKHVFCEKPVTVSGAQASELLELAAGKKVVFQVGHSERCHKFWEEIGKYQDIVDSATVVNIIRNSPFKGRAADVGVVEDLMIHDLDLVRMFYNDPQSIIASGAKVVTDKWDYAKAILRYEDKLITIENSRNDIKTERSIQFNGPHGILKVDLFSLKVFVSDDFDKSKDQVVQEFSYERRDHLYIEQEKFYDSILNGAEVFVSLEDGKRAVNLIEKVNEALDSGVEVRV